MSLRPSQFSHCQRAPAILYTTEESIDDRPWYVMLATVVYYHVLYHCFYFQCVLMEMYIPLNFLYMVKKISFICCIQKIFNSLSNLQLETLYTCTFLMIILYSIKFGLIPLFLLTPPYFNSVRQCDVL